MPACRGLPPSCVWAPLPCIFSAVTSPWNFATASSETSVAGRGDAGEQPTAPAIEACIQKTAQLAECLICGIAFARSVACRRHMRCANQRKRAEAFVPGPTLVVPISKIEVAGTASGVAHAIGAFDADARTSLLHLRYTESPSTETRFSACLPALTGVLVSSTGACCWDCRVGAPTVSALLVSHRPAAMTAKSCIGKDKDEL